MNGLPCPAWCTRDDERGDGLFVHTRTLVDGVDLAVTLEQGWRFEREGFAVTGGPELVVSDGCRAIELPATRELLTSFAAVVEAAEAIAAF